MKINLMVEGGAMTPGPAIAQKIGPLGIDMGKVISEVNKATEQFKGTKVPVELDVNTSTKTFKIHVSTPPVSQLLKKEFKLDKGSGDHKNVKVANVAIEEVIAVAKIKLPGMLEKTLKNAVKTVVGTCVSLGILIESKPAKEVAKEVTQGKYDNEIASEKTQVSDEKKKELDKFFTQFKAKQESALKKAEEEKTAAEAAKAAAMPAPTAVVGTSAKAEAGKKPAAAAAPAATKAVAKAAAKPAAKSAKK
ncbi:MAG: 50S ribosomal protein L11 [Nanoarchaeota archaeon]